MFEFKLPDIGEGVTEGEIVKWLVQEGETVKEDQPLVEVMTDKATVEIASPKTGTIKKIMAQEGEIIKVGGVLVQIKEKALGADVLPLTPKKEKEEDRPLFSASPVPTPSTAQASATVPPPAMGSPTMGRVLASPATRRLAREMGVDLTQVKGTGPSGRVTKEDVMSMNVGATQAGAPQVAAPLRSPVPTQKPEAPRHIPAGGEERIPLRGIRKKIAENMIRSKHSAAHFTHVDEADVTELVALRESLKSKAESRGIKLTYLPFIVRALCTALKEYPGLNAMLDEAKNEIVQKYYYNIGIAVATKDDDLIVPVIKNADQKSILELAEEIVGLADKARMGKLTPSDLQGGTFTITSLGPLGGLFATPIINYPEVAILGVHLFKDRPVVREGEVVVRKMTHLSLSLDHRIVDGALGARFLNTLIQYLEDPKLLLFDA